jgi:glutamyl-tRNA synthetase
MKANGFRSDRPFRAFADGPHSHGNARTALLNWLYARRHGGTFILRFDDTDLERSKAEYAESIEEDLAWLGVKPDLVRRQSERMAAYDAAADQLKKQGQLYPAYETADELDRRRKRQQALGRPPIYDRAALKLTDADRADLEASGRRPHWRFRLEPRIVHWDDIARGESHIDSASLSDPVLRREDGTYLYTLPSVVDDIEFGVTHVIRGEDHITNTAVQIQIFEALADAAPRFGHHNLLTDAGGEGLSKRTGSLSIASLRERGIESLAVAALAVLVGSAGPVRPVGSLDELSQMVELTNLSRGSARFDETELDALSARAARDALCGRCRQARGARNLGTGRGDLLACGARQSRPSRGREDLAGGHRGRHQAGRRRSRVSRTRRLAASRRRVGPVDLGWWTKELREVTGRKGRELFHPLRLALTGCESDPELAVLLPLIGRARALARLSAPSA